MTTNRIKISAGRVDKLPRPSSGQVIYRDTELTGFGLRVGTQTLTYFVEKRVDGRNVRHSLGVHGQLTADEARKNAQKRLGQMTDGRDLNAERRARNAAAKVARVAALDAKPRTVAALCDLYVEHQEAAGKQSAIDARGIFAKHLKGTEFAALPARDLSAKQVTALVRGVVEKGHKRTAAKLRSYLRAAYALAQGAETNAEAPAELIPYEIEVNPVASTAAIKESSNERTVVLNEAELGEAVRLLRRRRVDAYGDALAALELSLVLGGQRIAQVLRITIADLDEDAGTVTLRDPKGKRSKPRLHVLPITEAAHDVLQTILKNRRAEWLFGDKTAATVPRTVADKGVELLALVQANVSKALGGKAPARPKIEPRDLRRTAETMLAEMGISKDVRAQLLSHGLGGVQDKHYDMHKYMAEKRNALQAWAERLDTLAAIPLEQHAVRRAKVVDIRAGKPSAKPRRAVPTPRVRKAS